MESAKVFESIHFETSDRTISVTVYASLPFWNRNGSPDFRIIKDIAFPEGEYDIFYVSENGKRTFLKKARL